MAEQPAKFKVGDRVSVAIIAEKYWKVLDYWGNYIAVVTEVSSKRHDLLPDMQLYRLNFEDPTARQALGDELFMECTLSARPE